MTGVPWIDRMNRAARWYHFWNPWSGPVGGIICAALVNALFFAVAGLARLLG